MLQEPAGNTCPSQARSEWKNYAQRSRPVSVETFLRHGVAANRFRRFGWMSRGWTKDPVAGRIVVFLAYEVDRNGREIEGKRG
jgi:hypothetical protein